jgi:hypothetical protein
MGIGIGLLFLSRLSIFTDFVIYISYFTEYSYVL